MKQVYYLNDKNNFFNNAETMHDCIISSIAIIKNSLVLEYNNLENYKPENYKKVKVTYKLRDGFTLSIIKAKSSGTKEEFYTDDAEKINDLNKFNLLMYKYSIDMYDEMTLDILINEKNSKNVRISFTPEKIVYEWN